MIVIMIAFNSMNSNCYVFSACCEIDTVLKTKTAPCAPITTCGSCQSIICVMDTCNYWCSAFEPSWYLRDALLLPREAAVNRHLIF